MLAGKYFESKLSSPSTEDEEDIDIDYDYQEVRSFDRSSAGSIPWAEDAIKQNQQEWERVESYFCNENLEHLPTVDKELFREILEWKKFFPYANRHAANKKKVYHTKKVADKKLPENYLESDNETLVEYSFDNLKSKKTLLRDSIYIPKNKEQEIRNTEKQSAKSVNFPIKLINDSSMNTLNKNFAKNLRISSVPKSNKRNSINHNNSFVPTVQNLQTQTIPMKIIQRHFPNPNFHPFYPSQSAKFLLEKYPNSVVTIEKKISPHSATYFRMPPVYNHNHKGKGIPAQSSYQNRLVNQSHGYGSVGVSRLATSVSSKQVVLPNLPSLNAVHSNDVPLQSNLRSDVRSISAINSKHYGNRQIKTISDLKRIEYLPSLSASNNYKYHP
ncbi:uncharacterized protein LOC129611843 [Condylostylus longicornis]|uniref:uncharacterized protein LOC129611843 n=1 Tax=Condylostylus longicornis TaxID=2530218 RepID=UPI00244DD376|nr:uncharacterized protein LOC129611843 [Condylostylus longicornis]